MERVGGRRFNRKDSGGKKLRGGKGGATVKKKKRTSLVEAKKTKVE